MGFSKETLERSRRLMGADMEKKMNSMKGQGVSSTYFDNTPTNNYISESDMRQRNPSYVQNNNGSRNIDSLNIPDIVKQSFKETEIDVNNLNPQYQQTKVFSDIIESYAQELENGTFQHQLNEEVISTNKNYNSTNDSIDYNRIAQIIEECIDRKINKLNENTVKGIRLKDGKISLQDHQGNVYSASLEYKGNINEQKNKKKVL